MTLYEIADNLRTKLEQVEIDEETGELLNLDDLEKDEALFQDKLEACGVYAKEMAADIESYKTEMASLKKRLDGLTKKYDAFTQYIGLNMIMAETASYETAKVKLSFRHSSAVEITDEKSIPEEYMTEKVARSADKKAIKDAIKQGIEIPGARVVEHNNLQIK